MQAIAKNELFTEISSEESAGINGGAIKIGVSPEQQIFALGAAQYTFNTTLGNAALANSVLTAQYLRSFGSVVDFGF